MSIGDQKLHREMLIALYEELDPNFRGYGGADTFERLSNEIESEGLRYHLERLEENRLIDYNGESLIRPTAEAIEKLDREGYNTFLESEARYDFLRIAYEFDRTRSGVYIDESDVGEEAELSDEQLERNRWYLSEKGLIEPDGQGYFELTADGRNRYEEYRDNGMPIPRTHPVQQFTQHTIEEGDREKVETVFQEIVELAREEVIVIDQFGTKDPLWEWLEYVPDVVDVTIFASDAEIDPEAEGNFRDYAENRTGETRLRYLDYDDYPFHSREVVRDREEGWIWDHTVPDSGGSHHTISQLRPVNLETDLEAFEEAWASAEEVE